MRKMSKLAKSVLAISFVISGGTIFFVHHRKNTDQEKLREGVYRDLERQERKRRNKLELEQQMILTKQLEEERDRREREKIS